MKTKTHTILNMLLAILSIVLLIVGVSGGSWILIVLGAICFFAILIIRARQIAKMNHDIEKIKKADLNETDDFDNK